MMNLYKLQILFSRHEVNSVVGCFSLYCWWVFVL